MRVVNQPPGAPCWIDLMTSDPGDAARFYSGLFGWQLAIGGEETGYSTTATIDGLPVAGLSGVPAPSGVPTTWTLSFATFDLDASMAAVRENGGRVTMGPLDIMAEGRMAVAADPTGAVFGLWQPGRRTGMKIIEEPGTMAWCEVNTPDARRDRDFYAAVLGHRHAPLPDRDGGFDYRTFSVGDDDRMWGGVLPMEGDQWAGIPPHWMIYFAVDDTDAAAASVTELGGSIVVEPFDSPYGRIAVVMDPQGAVLSIMKPSYLEQAVTAE